MFADNKQSFLQHLERFLKPQIADKSVIFEVFTDTDGESKAIEIMRTFLNDPKTIIKNKVADTIRGALGKKGIETIKKIIGR